MINQQYPFKLPPLSYGYNDLEPFINGEIIKIHHRILMQNYVNKLNELLKNFPQYHDWTLTSLVAYADTLPPALRTGIKNYGGGLYNHFIYFNSMSPSGRIPTDELMTLIKNSFGNFDNMQKALYNSAAANFGCGYTWLVCDGNYRLQIMNTTKQNTPPLTMVSPVVAVDLWEHAFFPQYINNRNEYVKNWLKIADWRKIYDILMCRPVQEINMHNFI